MSFLQRLLRRMRTFVPVVVGAVIVFELVAFGVLIGAGVYPSDSFRAMYADSACLQANEFGYARYTQRDAGQVLELMTVITAHPFFGFTVNPGRQVTEWNHRTVNLHFRNEERYRRILGEGATEAPFTIGILGASVAVSWAEHVIENEAFLARLRAELPHLEGREIRVLNMAIGGSRQPTQMAIATFYSDLIDLAINLDGYSEIAVIQYPDYPIEFPMFSDVFYPAGDPGRYLRLAAAAHVCRAISDVPLRVPLLRYSNAYYLLWYNLSMRMGARLYRDTPRGGEAKEGDPVYPFDDDQVRDLYARYYEKYTRNQYRLLAANGIPSYHFLQPNQYVAGSKPFSAEELVQAFGYGQAEEVTARYELLRTVVRDLRAEGVAAFDLTQAFADVEDTVYVDQCCHVNDRGNAILAERIADVIVREERARLAAAR